MIIIVPRTEVDIRPYSTITKSVQQQLHAFFGRFVNRPYKKEDRYEGRSSHHIRHGGSKPPPYI